MTIEEAAGLVLEAAQLSEYAETFVLDMGEPVGIVDLVHKYAAAVNVSELRIKFTGLRPGEKLNEKVFSDSEVRIPTAHPKISATRATAIPPDFSDMLEELYAATAVNDARRTVSLLRAMLPDYQPAHQTLTPASVGAPYPDGL